MCLEFADLAGTNLLNASLDNASLRGASLRNCNLLGANLSEACLDLCDFSFACLKDTCFCESSLIGALFKGASFGGTDIAGCNISRALFSTGSAFNLNFIDTDDMRLCLYEDEQIQARCSFSSPPIVVTGLAYPIICMDGHIKIGHLLEKTGRLLSTINDNSPLFAATDSSLKAFISAHSLLIRMLLEIRGAEEASDRRLSA